MRTFNIKLHHVQDKQYQVVAYLTDLQQPEQSLIVPLVNLMISPTSSNNEYKTEVDYTGFTQFQKLGAKKLSSLIFNWTYLVERKLKRDDNPFEDIQRYIENDISRDIIKILVESKPSLTANIVTIENEIANVGNKSLQDLPQMLRLLDACNYDSVAFDLSMLNSFDLDTQYAMYTHHVEQSNDKA